MARPNMQLTGTVLDSPDAQALAAFYESLLGWSREKDTPKWVKLVPPGGGAGLSFQSEPAYVRPKWPSSRDRQQMMLHLDIEVADLDAAVEYAVRCGAQVAEFQPQERVRVMLDPAGHPFCLWVRSTPGP